MTTTTYDAPHPALVSELPPIGALRPSLVQRLRTELARRRMERAFERTLRLAGPTEHGDLLVLARRG